MANKYLQVVVGDSRKGWIEFDLTDGTFAAANEIISLHCDARSLTPNKSPIPSSAIGMLCGDKYQFSNVDETVDSVAMELIYTDGYELANVQSDYWDKMIAKLGLTVGVRWGVTAKASGRRYHESVGPLVLCSPPGMTTSGGVFYNVQVDGTIGHGTVA